MKAEDTYRNNRIEDLASLLSHDDNSLSGLPDDFTGEKEREIYNYLEKMKNSRGDDMSMVDNAWDKLLTRFEKENLIPEIGKKRSISLSFIVRIAAMFIIAVGLTITGKYIISQNLTAPSQTVTTSAFQKNLRVELSDGSVIVLNRNSKLTFPEKFERETRQISLSGEAFCEIAPDADRPFIIDAGKAEVTVLGTSFNVKTNNRNNEVEVLVETGKVLVSSSNGDHEITLEPGNIGTVNNSNASLSVNNDLNYRSWNTEVLTYEGESLEKAIRDLNQVYNINIIAKDENILQRRINSTFYKQPADTILSIICRSFSLTYEKSGEVYYISEK